MSPGYRWRDPARAAAPTDIEPEETNMVSKAVPVETYARQQEAAEPARVRVRAEARADQAGERGRPARTFTSGPVPAPAVTSKPATPDVPRWQEPPPAEPGVASYVGAVVRMLQEHPGKWAIVREGVSMGASASSWTKRGCETANRTRYADGKKVRDIYARWPEPTAAGYPDGEEAGQ